MLFHRWRFGENLVSSMFNGNKVFTTQATESQDRVTQRIRALMVLIACALLVMWLVNIPMPTIS
jgi:hypothetical protein